MSPDLQNLWGKNFDKLDKDRLEIVIGRWHTGWNLCHLGASGTSPVRQMGVWCNWELVPADIDGHQTALTKCQYKWEDHRQMSFWCNCTGSRWSKKRPVSASAGWESNYSCQKLPWDRLRQVLCVAFPINLLTSPTARGLCGSANRGKPRVHL